MTDNRWGAPRSDGSYATWGLPSPSPTTVGPDPRAGKVERSATELALDAVKAQALWDMAEQIEKYSSRDQPQRFTEHDLADAGAVGYLRNAAAELHPEFARRLAQGTTADPFTPADVGDIDPATATDAELAQIQGQAEPPVGTVVWSADGERWTSHGPNRWSLTYGGMGTWAAVQKAGRVTVVPNDGRVCGDHGPRIGGDGVPRCVLYPGHKDVEPALRHRAHESWGEVTW